jgi:hypothetical protein
MHVYDCTPVVRQMAREGKPTTVAALTDTWRLALAHDEPEIADIISLAVIDGYTGEQLTGEIGEHENVAMVEHKRLA